MPAGLILLSAVRCSPAPFRSTELAGGAEVTPDNARFFAAPGAGGACTSSAPPCTASSGAFQFVPGLRRRRPGWHRAAGRILVPCGLAAALSGLWMTLFYPCPPDDGELLDGLPPGVRRRPWSRDRPRLRRDPAARHRPAPRLDDPRLRDRPGRRHPGVLIHLSVDPPAASPASQQGTAAWAPAGRSTSRWPNGHPTVPVRPREGGTDEGDRPGPVRLTRRPASSRDVGHAGAGRRRGAGAGARGRGQRPRLARHARRPVPGAADGADDVRAAPARRRRSGAATSPAGWRRSARASPGSGPATRCTATSWRDGAFAEYVCAPADAGGAQAGAT